VPKASRAGAIGPLSQAATVTDAARYPLYGRDLNRTFGEIGLAGHWIKIMLHHMFLYKARLRPGWALIPE